MSVRGWISGLLATTCALAPASAAAVGFWTPDGLSFPYLDYNEDGVVELVAPPGGVVTLLAYARRVSHDDALAGLTLELTDADGEALVATVELMPRSAVFEFGAVTEEVLLVFRPTTPLAPGAVYTGTLVSASQSPPDGPAEISLTVSDAPPEPVSLDFAEADFEEERGSDPASEVCCETEDRSLCFPTREVSGASLTVRLTDDPLVRGQHLVWTTKGDPEPHPRGDACDSMAYQPFCPSTVGVGFPAQQDEYCLTVGMTSLVDGSERHGARVCTRGYYLMPPSEPTLSEFAREEFAARCIDVPRNADGTPFDPPPEEGCACLTGQATAPGWWLVLALVRRRRAARG
jgi:hypothetical protein